VIQGNIIATIDEPGLPIGEMSFLTGEPRTASIIAAEPSKMLRVKKKEQKKILRENPTIVNTLMSALVKRLGETTKKLFDAQEDAKSNTGELEELRAELEIKAAALDEARNLILSGEAIDPDPKTAEIQANCDWLARYAANETSQKKGNLVILEQLLKAIQEQRAGQLQDDGAKNIFALVTDYLAYLQAQQQSKVVNPVIQEEKIPEKLRELLGK